MRRSWILSGLLLALGWASGARAQLSGFGIGIIVGDPTGISAKYWLAKTSALDLAVAWSFGDKGAFHLHADYLFHFPDLIKTNAKVRIPLFLGVGGRTRFKDETNLGIRFPVGAILVFPDVPIDPFLEVAPIMDLVPATDFAVNGAVGVRYYF